MRFAISNVHNFYDSDFFPTLGDYRAIQSLQVEAVNHLAALDLAEYLPMQPRIAAAPKPGGGFRVVHQLQPLDHIIYTAIAFEFGSAIEVQRPPREALVACSYRIQIDPNTGSLFANDSGYSSFINKSLELASSHAWVLVTDITDFYNQIYSHRLRNNLTYASPDKDDLARVLERFLHRVNDGGASKGIPVGPPASIVFAEASLLDVDQFLSSRTTPYIRYVDDIRIFAGSRRELLALLEHLSLYLYQNHRLCLSSSKTRILRTEEFRATYLDNPETAERSRIHARLEALGDVDLYGIGASSAAAPEEPSRGDVQRRVLRELMTEICQRPILDLGLARHVLRRCRKLRTTVIAEQLWKNFDFFAPVIRDVVLYLDAVCSPSYLRRHERLAIEVLEQSESISLDYVAYWFGYLAALKLPFLRNAAFYRFIFDGPHLDNQAIAALRIRDLSWVREKKVRFDSLGDRDRRAVLHASFLMPRDERAHWLDSLRTRDYLESLVVRWARASQ